MKKLLLVFGALVLALGVFADDKGEARDRIQCRSGLSAPRGGSADEVAEIKAVLLKDMELAAQGKFVELGELLTPDYVEIGPHGVFNKTQVMWAFLAMDGKHPEEFMLVLVAQKTRGCGPVAAREVNLRMTARRPSFVKFYEEQIAKLVPTVKASAALGLKTQKFIDIRIDGNLARVVSECDTIDSKTRGVMRLISIVILRRIDGKWLIAQSDNVTY